MDYSRTSCMLDYGIQKWMQQLEALKVAYLFRIKQTKGFKELIYSTTKFRLTSQK